MLHETQEYIGDFGGLLLGGKGVYNPEGHRLVCFLGKSPYAYPGLAFKKDGQNQLQF